MTAPGISTELAQVFVPSAQQKFDGLNDLLEVLFEEGPSPAVIEAIYRTSFDLKTLSAAFDLKELIDTIVRDVDEPLNRIRIRGQRPTEKTASELRTSVDNLRKSVNALVPETTALQADSPEAPQSESALLNKRHEDVSSMLTAVGQISIWSFHDIINYLAKLQGYAEMLDDIKVALNEAPLSPVLRDRVAELTSLQQKISENTTSISNAIARIRTARGKISSQVVRLPLRTTIEKLMRATLFNKSNVTWSASMLPNVVVEQDAAIFECVWMSLWRLLAEWLSPETGLRAFCETRIKLGKRGGTNTTTPDKLLLYFWMEPRVQTNALRINVEKISFSSELPKIDLGHVFQTVSHVASKHGLTVEAGMTPEGHPIFSLALACGPETAELQELPQVAKQTQHAPAPVMQKATENQEYVLVVDDERDLRSLLELKLTRLGYPVIAVENISEARNILRKEKIRLVLADLFLSQESGLELLHEVKSGYPDIPFVFMSSANEDDLSPTILEVLSKYANEFLRKPIASQLLRETIAKYYS